MMNLKKKKPPHPPLLPTDPGERGRARVLMHYGDNPYESGVSTLAGELLIKPMQGGTTDQAVVAKAREDLNVCVARLEKEVGNNDYLLGPTFTLADIPFVSWAMLIPNLKVEV